MKVLAIVKYYGDLRALVAEHEAKYLIMVGLKDIELGEHEKCLCCGEGFIPVEEFDDQAAALDKLKHYDRI